MKQIDLDKRFNDWFNENEGFALRAERFYEDLNKFSTREAQAARMYLWLKSAYEYGVMVGAKESSDTLLDYATALAGCPVVAKTPTENYDNAANSLITYWNNVFKQGEDCE